MSFCKGSEAIVKRIDCFLLSKKVCTRNYIYNHGCKFVVPLTISLSFSKLKRKDKCHEFHLN